MVAGRTAELSEGITISFASGFTGELIDVNPVAMKRDVVPLPHQGISAPSANQFGNLPKRFSKIADAGQLTFTMHLNSGLASTKQPPIAGTAETITVTLPLANVGGTAASLSGSGGIIDAKLNGKLSDPLIWDITVEWSGAVTVSPATTS